jgi:hypothetical protein
MAWTDTEICLNIASDGHLEVAIANLETFGTND